MPGVAASGSASRSRLATACGEGAAAAATWLAVLILTAVGTGCGTRSGPAPVVAPVAPAPEGFYRIRYGDTLSEIAERRGIGLETLAAWNRLEPPYGIDAGRLLRIEPPPRGQMPETSAPDPPRTAARSTPGRATDDADGAKEAGPARASREGSRAAPSVPATNPGIVWQWPLRGSVVQTFRAGDRTRQGIRIAARPGQWVAAAAAGRVVYSGGGLKGYGNLIIVKHDEEWLSAYGLNRKVLISKGEKVQRGQTIAAVGVAPNGNAQLHFEIRKNGAAVDPLEHLPRSP